MKKILTVLVALILCVVAGAFWFIYREKTVAGTVVDCLSNEPVKSADVNLFQKGWGFDPFPTREKTYSSTVKTDQSGNFQINYRLGNIAHLEVQKKSYVTARQEEYPKKSVVIRMLQGERPKEVTYNCRLSSECYQRSFENGVSVTINLCQQAPLQ